MVGQGVSLVGTWMQQTGIQWLVYAKTGSPAMLGAVMFFGQIPAFFLAPIAGVFSDRLDRRRTLFVTQAVAMTQAVLLVALMLTGATVGVLSGGPPLRRALRQLAIGLGAAAVTYCLGLLFGTATG